MSKNVNSNSNGSILPQSTIAFYLKTKKKYQTNNKSNEIVKQRPVYVKRNEFKNYIYNITIMVMYFRKVQR